ncbi:MAG TPA: lytic transglycosylase domain-containing protein [Streptosporangiaceae bacterium]|nr:lytic transglycosylase domain-containing protein [Streptosporangiaceae bacterium]
MATAARSVTPVLRGVAGCSALLLLVSGAQGRTLLPPPGGSARTVLPPSGAQARILRPLSGGAARAPAMSAAAIARDAGVFRQIILPDLLVVVPTGITDQQLTRLSKITGIRHMIAFDGAEIKAGNRAVNVIGVNPATFRSWVPLQTASNQAFWTALASGQFVAARSARGSLGLVRGASYQLTGSTTRTVTFGAAASFGITGVDLLVNTRTSRQLGLVHRVAALISAPGDRLAALIAKVNQVLGPSSKIVSLRQQEQLPVTNVSSGQQPTTYLQLFQESAARYCPALSWTVLAAIGQIESADGTNNGPSTAGALGPMQFLPSTWAVWGIDGFGRTGPPDIMNPYDAVPSAARMLCADGASAGSSGLASAVFAYNHANWYVNEVLSLAQVYAATYG